MEVVALNKMQSKKLVAWRKATGKEGYGLVRISMLIRAPIHQHIQSQLH